MKTSNFCFLIVRVFCLSLFIPSVFFSITSAKGQGTTQEIEERVPVRPSEVEEMMRSLHDEGEVVGNKGPTHHKKRKELRSIPDRPSLSSLFDQMRREMEEFHSQFFNNDFFMDPHMDLSVDRGSGQHRWVEGENEKILEIEHSNKDVPLNIEIKENKIILSSQEKVEKIEGKDKGTRFQSFGQFKKILSLPEDVDAKKASIEEKEGKIIVRFPLKSSDNSGES